jgi:hypothetical protein
LVEVEVEVSSHHPRHRPSQVLKYWLVEVEV